MKKTSLIRKLLILSVYNSIDNYKTIMLYLKQGLKCNDCNKLCGLCDCDNINIFLNEKDIQNKAIKLIIFIISNNDLNNLDIYLKTLPISFDEKTTILNKIKLILNKF